MKKKSSISSNHALSSEAFATVTCSAPSVYPQALCYFTAGICWANLTETITTAEAELISCYQIALFQLLLSSEGFSPSCSHPEERPHRTR